VEADPGAGGYRAANIRLAPSILTADLGRLADEIRAAETAGVDWVHLDVMDGRFVPNISIGPLIVSAVRKVTNLPLDVHLMIVEPEKYVAAFAEAGANNITVHAEASVHLHRLIYQIRDLGTRAGVAINPATPLSAVEEIINDINVLLVMSVNPGFGGQSFIPSALSKIRRARSLLDRSKSSADLEVDGGINAENIAEAARAGADVFVAGSSVYNKTRSVNESVALLRGALLAGEASS
jgi:ribulose-phosphate 3-epimerase